MSSKNLYCKNSMLLHATVVHNKCVHMYLPLYITEYLHAIMRVGGRISQNEETTVITYVKKGTVEEEMYEKHMSNVTPTVITTLSKTTTTTATATATATAAATATSRKRRRTDSTVTAAAAATDNDDYDDSNASSDESGTEETKGGKN
jgi:hypothetical protein